MDEPSYHSYEVDRDFGQLQDAINVYNNPAFTAEENEFMRGEFQKELLVKLIDGVVWIF